MITPAKWQAKGGKKNEDFRKDIVPHMSKVVYYPESSDIFDINECAGIAYYSFDKNIHDSKTIINRCTKQSLYNNEVTRKFCGCLNNRGLELFNKINKLGIKTVRISGYSRNGIYQVWLNNKVSVHSAWTKSLLSPDGKFHCISICRVINYKDIHEIPDDSKLVFASNNIDECESFKSWVYTKLVRYFVSISLCGLTGIATSNEWWRFVPDPGPFDHIFTDAELYKKYNLTEEEINVIESVIKPR